MGHDRHVASDHPHSAATDTSGIVGRQGRYPVVESPAPALRIGGVPLVPVGPLRMYCCGITPYDVTHVGHAATFVWADLITTLAHAGGASTEVCRNVTDIDDVLTEAARAQGWHYDELALTQEFHFERDMKALSVTPPAHAPHARAHVNAVERLAAALLESGAAYERNGYVYFRGEDVPQRAGLDAESALAASNEYGDQHDVPDRDSVFDVAVWRPSREDDPAWPSPWGWGRPGWHAECAAMALTCLGSSVEVLLGGIDLAFPHHAYQAAMIEAATGVTPFARTVVHVGEVRHGGTKMAKSVGNLVLVSDLLTRHAAPAIRLGLLNRPLTEPWECTEQVFVDAAEMLAQLMAASASGPDIDDGAVLARLSDGLDVPGAIAVALERGGASARTARRLLKVG